MPPAIPLFTFDVNGKANRGVCSTRAGTFFAELPVRSIRSIKDVDHSEFGTIVYGPLRMTLDEATSDFKRLNDSAHSSTAALRREIARLGSLGGTKSHPSASIKSVLAGSPKIHLQVDDNDAVTIKGIRRPNVTASISARAPHFLLRRIIDVATDLLSCAVDSQLGIAPSTDDLLEAVKHAISRDKGMCPISDSLICTYVLPLLEKMKDSEPWSVLKPAREDSDDAEVIHGLMNQFLDKSRQADVHGERKQVKRLRKEVRDRKKTAHTVFVTNLPSNITEEALFDLFNSVTPEKNSVYKVKLPRDEESGAIKTYAFVTCRSKKATAAVLAKNDWIINDKKLYVASRNEDDASPLSKRQNTGDIPENLEREIENIVKSNPGCNVSQIPDLVSKGSSGLSFHPRELGFHNLTQALQSLSTIRLEPKDVTGSNRPVYYAYPN